MFQNLLAPVGAQVVNVIVALLILLVGWIVARIVGGAVEGLLRRTGLHSRLDGFLSQSGVSKAPDSAKLLGSIVFWVIMVFVLIAFFQVLSLSMVAGVLSQMLNAVFLYLPRLLAAGLLILVAWVLATVLRMVIVRVLTGLRIDERLTRTSADEAAGAAGATPPAPTIANAAGEIIYWLIWLLFLPAILSALNLTGILAPVQGMVDKLLAFLPNLLAAAVILVVGLFVASILRRIVTSILAAAGLDRLGARIGLGREGGASTPSAILGLIVYIMVLIPVITAALNALQLQAVTQPISNVLNLILTALPNIFAAAVVLVLAFVVGRLLANLIADLLAGIGFDGLPARLGFRAMPAAGANTPSRVAGQVVLAAIMVFAVMEAAQMLGFSALTAIVSDFLVFAGHVFLGLVIIALGLWLANLAATAVRASGTPNAGLLATVARVAILVLASAMGLRQMGVANEIINLAFGLLLGAIAIAVGLAFGLGARESAGREVQRWLGEIRPGSEPPRPPAPPTQPGGPL